MSIKNMEYTPVKYDSVIIEYDMDNHTGSFEGTVKQININSDDYVNYYIVIKNSDSSVWKIQNDEDGVVLYKRVAKGLSKVIALENHFTIEKE